MAVVGTMPDGEAIHSASIEGYGLKAEFISYGATLKSLMHERFDHSLVLGLPNAEDYVGHGMYFGATVGRFANRIANAQFSIEETSHALDKNFLGKHILHGGVDGSGVRNWQLVANDQTTVKFRDVLPDGHMGFPGTLTVELTFELLPEATLAVLIEATTDKTTVCNFAHHSYFNLSAASDILDHELTVFADEYLAVDEELIPTGERVAVTRQDFDFRESKSLGAVVPKRLLDHNFCIGTSRRLLQTVAILREGVSGFAMEISSTEAGLQVYDGSGLDGYVDKNGFKPFSAYAGIALEPQGWPDSPNQSGFPSDILMPGDKYIQKSQFRFF